MKTNEKIPNNIEQYFVDTGFKICSFTENLEKSKENIIDLIISDN